MDNLSIPDESIAIGHQAAEIAASALDELGRELIRQKALDIARQIEIYLSYHNYSTIDEIEKDAELSSIAVTTIGKSGYSAVHDTQAVNRFHFSLATLHKDLHTYRYVFPQFWKIIERSLTEESDGYYDWPEQDGQTYRKYMYCVPIFPKQIAPLGLVIATTISIDEFLQPSREIRERIITLSERVDEFTKKEQKRNLQLRNINHYSSRISSFLTTQDLLPYVTETLLTTFQLSSVRVFLVGGSTPGPILASQAGSLPCPPDAGDLDSLDSVIVNKVCNTGKPYRTKEILPDLHVDPKGPCEPERMVIPLKIGRKILGALDLMKDKSQPFGDFDFYTFFPLADQIAFALENVRLNTEIREMAVIEERNRIAREIHDTLAQGFAGISMQTETAKQALKNNELSEVETILDRIRNLAREKLSEARRSVQSLRPNIILQEDLEVLLRSELAQLSEFMNIKTKFEVAGKQPLLQSEIKLSLLRICQETINNIKKHAHASQVNVALTYNETAICLDIEDDGIGFSSQTPQSNSFGLVFMSERARLVGGTVTVESVEGVGTKIHANIPL